jgi:hypothetical protein
MMLTVAVVSQYGNNPENIKKAVKFCQYVFNKGCAPFASHVFYSGMLDDGILEQRQLGMEAGLEFINVCDEMWVFLVDSVFSNGMTKEILFALSKKMPIRYFNANDVNNIYEVSDPVPLAILSLAFGLACGKDIAEASQNLDKLLGAGLAERDLEAEAIFEKEKNDVGRG